MRTWFRVNKTTTAKRSLSIFGRFPLRKTLLRLLQWPSRIKITGVYSPWISFVQQQSFFGDWQAFLIPKFVFGSTRNNFRLRKKTELVSYLTIVLNIYLEDDSLIYTLYNLNCDCNPSFNSLLILCVYLINLFHDNKRTFLHVSSSPLNCSVIRMQRSK